VFGAEKGLADKLNGKKLSIAIVQARFNESITNALAGAASSAVKPTTLSWLPMKVARR